QLHAALNRTFYPMGVSTPGQVLFPERDIHIHLYYNDLVFRTIKLKTDPDLQLPKNRVSIIAAFDEPPDEELRNTLISFGEPIPLVLKVRHPMQANELLKTYSGRYNRLLFWIQNDDQQDLFHSSPTTAKRRLN